MNISQVVFEAQWINRIFPQNIQEIDKKLFEPLLQSLSREVKIQVMTNVSLNNELFLKEGFRFRIRMESFGDTWQSKVYNKPVYQLKSFVKNAIRKKILIDQALWCFDQFSTGGYFHWITEIAPRLWLADQYVDKKIPLLIPEYFITKWSFAIDFLKPFNRAIIILKENEVAVIRHLTFVSPPGGPFNYQPTPVYSSSAFLKNYYFDPSYPSQNPKIYISRARSGKRMILNEMEVEDLVVSNGYQVIYSEQLSLRDQINVFSRASHLLSIHGAGLSNMVFMTPNAKVIEIRHRENNHMLCFFYTLAHTFSHSYFYSFGDDKRDSLKTELRPEDKSIHADIDMLSDVIRSSEKS